MTRLDRRQLIGTAAAIACSALLASWAPAASAQTADEIKKKGSITIGMLVDFPPYGTMNSSNQPDGYDADVARLMAKDLGVKLNLVPVTGPNRIPFLLTNKVDLLVASLAAMGASFFGIDVSMAFIAISAVSVLLFSGLILYDTSRIINGGETNYIMATVALYLDILNIFTSLLQLLGFASNDD